MRGFAESVNREQAVLAEINLVRIHREDLFLSQAMLQHHRNNRFRKLAPQRPLASQKEAPCKLLCNRARALQPLLFANIPNKCTEDTLYVQTMMLKEFLVLAGRYSINKDSRYVLEFNQTAFGSPLAGKVGNQISRTVVDFCRVLENVPVQPLIEDLAVLVIVKAED